jgi:hypothetical protein
VSPRKRMTTRLGLKLDPVTRSLLVALQWYEGAPSASELLRVLVRRTARDHVESARHDPNAAPLCGVCSAYRAAVASEPDALTEQRAVPMSGKAPKLAPELVPERVRPEPDRAERGNGAEPHARKARAAKPRRKGRKVRHPVDGAPVASKRPRQ